MNLLIAYSRREGLKEIFGYVIRENAPMLEMCRKLGFDIEASSDAPEILNVSLGLLPIVTEETTEQVQKLRQDPEKCVAVFRERSCSNNKLKRDSDSY